LQMNEVTKEVLYKFVELHRRHPDGDVLFLWVQAGGKVASQPCVQADDYPSEQLAVLHDKIRENQRVLRRTFRR